MPDDRRRSWTFLTNHGHVLLTVAADPDVRVAEIAARVRISERATLSILRDLESEGYLVRTHQGRRTHYVVQPHRPFRHPAHAGHEIDELLGLFTPGRAAEPAHPPPERRAAGGEP